MSSSSRVNPEHAQECGSVVKYMKEELDMPWTQWHIGPKARLLEEWGVQGFPTCLIVDAEGVVRQRISHFDEDSRALIRRLVET